MYVVYSLINCKFCTAAVELLEAAGEDYRVHYLDDNKKFLNEMKNSYYWKTVPMIFENEEFIGGYSDLVTVFKEKYDSV